MLICLMSKQLCATCLGVFQNLEVVELHRYKKPLEGGEAVDILMSHHLTFEALKYARDLGCFLCYLTWERLPEPCQSKLLNGEAALQRRRVEHYHWHSYGQQSCATKLQIRSYTPDEGDSRIYIYVHFTADVKNLKGVSPQLTPYRMVPLSYFTGMYIHT